MSEANSFDSLGISSYQTMLAVTQSQISLKKLLSVCLKHYDLTTIQWLVIGLLLEQPEKPITIARKLGVTPPYITLILNQIEKLGYTTQSIIEDDGRSKMIVISPKGKLLAREVETKLMTCVKRELGSLELADLKTFFEVSDYIGKNIKHH
jgi:DNA-binding MarR family transcriptional regulator